MMKTQERSSVKIGKGRLAILNFNSARRFAGLLAAAALLLASPWLLAQTVGTGSIVGIVMDPQGKPLADIKVGITDKATRARIHVTTSAVGLYSSGPIQPGDYVLLVEIKGFNPALLPVVVQVGNVTHADVTMRVGPEAGQVQVPGGTTVNIEQGTVQSVVSGDEIEKLPINGRNLADLAQLEPGVQMQDGGNFTGKDGLSTISLLGQYGRSERIELDGVDISEETVGATTQNIPVSAVREFQLSQSLLDLSTGLTSSGGVNVITRSGSDQIHGGLFGVFRGNQGAADLPGSTASFSPSFQRELFGGDAGGAIIKDKVFWFADAERAKQDLTTCEAFAPPFDGLEATLAEPYREFNTDERVDWNMRGSTRAFYRFNFFQNSDQRPTGSASSTQQSRDTNNTATNALGVDFSTGPYAHSLRFEYLKLRNEMEDRTGSLGGADNPIPGLGINIGASTAGNCILSEGGSYCGGPSWLGPQQTVQSDKLARYDGSRMMGKHIIRYGITFNRIDSGRLSAYSAFPQVGTTSLVGSTSSDPTSYPADWVSLGNGVEFSTSKTSFGFPGGGLGPDNRVEMYVGDGWKAKPKLTLTYGLHYVRDSGRTDSGLGALPDLNQWGAGLGERIRNPNENFAPQLGFAWDAGGTGKTVIRGGGGLFYGNSLWNYPLLDSPSRLAKGIFADSPEVCQGGVGNAFNWPTSPGAAGTSIAGAATVVANPTTGALQVLPNFCGATISTVAPQILALSSAFQAAAAGVTGQQPNGNFVGTTLTALNPSYDLFYPGYRTPRSWQANLGVEKEIRPGTVLSVDYVRNIGEHYLIGQDINHSGAARSFNQANAVTARDAAQVANGCAPGLGEVTCMINSTFVNGTPLGVAGAQAAYSRAGLDSNLQAAGGGPCSYCAFPGTNPITENNGALGGVDMLFPDGRSVYSGVQMRLVTRIDKPVRGVKTANLQVSYALSRLVSQMQDQDFVNLATDNDDPRRFTGPSALERKHQVSFTGTFDLPFYTKISMIGHFYSPLPQTLQLPELTNGGEIFATDWLGAGLGAAAAPEPVPGTQVGQFGHSITIDNLQSAINTYNHTFAGSLTPAGDCLVGNNIQCPGLIAGTQVMTQADMAALGWIMPTLASVAPHAVATPWLKTMDLRVAWPLKVKDRVTIEPSASVFNVFNFANAFQPGNMPSGSLLPGPNGVLAPNVVGGVAPGSSYTPFRTSLQSGTYALGAPRQFEFGLRITF
jgi:hypothetical protein